MATQVEPKDIISKGGDDLSNPVSGLNSFLITKQLPRENKIKNKSRKQTASFNEETKENKKINASHSKI